MSSIRFVIFASFVILGWCDNVRGIGEVTLVDKLINSYLEAEKDLWVVILKREDVTLQKMYDVHTQYLTANLGGSNVLMNSTYVQNVPFKVAESIVLINMTSYDLAEEFFERRNYTVLSEKANRAMNLTGLFDAVFNATINSSEYTQELAAVSSSSFF